MDWTPTGSEYRVIQNGIIIARANYANHAWYAYVFPPEKPPQQSSFATLEEAKAWAEEALK